MSGNQFNRRNFLKLMGWSGAGAALTGCDLPSYVTLEEGEEEVVSYLTPEEFVIPGVGVYYASTCQQCSAGCGVHGRVREGRVLKMEGNPDSPVNGSGLCQMGQAAVQTHYNPDRVRAPMVRKGNGFTEISWDEAFSLVNEKAGPDSGLKGDRFAWFTGTVSGHQRLLIDAHLSAVGSDNHYSYELIHNAIVRQVNKAVLGEESPRYRLDKAETIVSFGADFLGTWVSPVNFAKDYAAFRTAPRGTLIQVEPNMTLTGANADLWVPVRPGTEGIVALGLANFVLGVAINDLPANVRSVVEKYDPSTVAAKTGISVERLTKMASALKKGRPSLVLAGASAESQEHGVDIVSAVMFLNIVLGNVGKTIESSGDFVFDGLAAKSGSTADLNAFNEAAKAKKLDVVFFQGANPAFTAPDAYKFKETLNSIPYKVAFTQFMDETSSQADLIIPLDSGLEDWGSHVSEYQPGDKAIIGMQQPLMNKVWDTKGFGEVLLALLKGRNVEGYSNYADYYSYLVDAFSSMPNVESGEKEWQGLLQRGLVEVEKASRRLSAKTPEVKDIPLPSESSDFPFHLVPATRLGMWDGRHANIPWLQEAPDQISKVVWDSWAEVHPKTAAKLGVKEGDFIKLASEEGALEVQVYVHRGVHPDVIAVPVGQGHEANGRYAEGRGVNPLKLLSPVKVAGTEELAMYATRVSATKVERDGLYVRFGGSEVQLGRRLVGTVSADTFNRTEGGS